MYIKEKKPICPLCDGTNTEFRGNGHCWGSSGREEGSYGGHEMSGHCKDCRIEFEIKMTYQYVNDLTFLGGPKIGKTGPTG